MILLFAASAISSACNRAPDDLREWRVSDHRHQAESAAESQESAPQVSGSAEPSLPGLEDVTVVAYRRACATCHGQLGRGDGPQGPLVKARDLSDPTWQAAVTNAQIAETIQKGRGLMPPSGLPASAVDGLVQLVRLLNRARVAAPPAPSASPSAGPGAGPHPPGASSSGPGAPSAEPPK